MENELNIAAILKDKPQGIKLYNWLYNTNVELDTISTTDEETAIWCTKKKDINTTTHFSFSKLGTMRGCLDGLQILLPSKEMRDWCKFAWKKGDILVNGDKNVHIIFEAFENDTYTRFKGKHYLWKEGNEEDYCKEETFLLTSVFEKVNDDAVKCYINIIEERLGGKLNRETLEVEKALPEFKDGDIVVYGKSVAICRKIYKHTLYFYVSIDETFGLLLDDNRVSAEGYRYATEAEKQRLFAALAKEDKRWNPDTKQIEDLPKKFKPMDWCLMKDSAKYWELCQFAYTRKIHGTTIYSAVGGLIYYKCIPYNEETKHLLGTTDEWKGDE